VGDRTIPAYRANGWSGRGFPVVLVVAGDLRVACPHLRMSAGLAQQGLTGRCQPVRAQGDVSGLPDVASILPVVSVGARRAGAAPLDAAVAWVAPMPRATSPAGDHGFLLGGDASTWLYAATIPGSGLAWLRNGRLSTPGHHLQPLVRWA